LNASAAKVPETPEPDPRDSRHRRVHGGRDLSIAYGKTQPLVDGNRDSCVVTPMLIAGDVKRTASEGDFLARAEGACRRIACAQHRKQCRRGNPQSGVDGASAPNICTANNSRYAKRCPLASSL